MSDEYKIEYTFNSNIEKLEGCLEYWGELVTGKIFLDKDQTEPIGSISFNRFQLSEMPEKYVNVNDALDYAYLGQFSIYFKDNGELSEETRDLFNLNEYEEPDTLIVDLSIEMDDMYRNKKNLQLIIGDIIRNFKQGYTLISLECEQCLLLNTDISENTVDTEKNKLIEQMKTFDQKLENLDNLFNEIGFLKHRHSVEDIKDFPEQYLKQLYEQEDRFFYARFIVN